MAWNEIRLGFKSLRTVTFSRAELFAKIVHIFAIAILFIQFSSLYENLVAPVFYFGGFTLFEREDKLVEWVLIICASALLPLRLDSPSKFFLWGSFIFLLMPATVLSILQSSDRGALLIMYAGTLLVGLLVRFLGLLKSNRKAVSLNNFKPVVRVIVALYAIVVLACWVIFGGIQTLSFSSVYDYRFDINDELVFPMNYLVPIFGGTLSSLVVAYSLAKRRYHFAITMIVFGFLLFGITTHKVFLFYPFLVVFFYIVFRSKDPIRLLVLSLIFVTAIALITKEEEIEAIGMLFANRSIFLPANIHFEYFNEFSRIGFQYWSESKFGLGLVESKLPIPSMNYIGEIMTGDARVGANTGWLAIGYMNLGIIGVGIYSLILSVVLVLLDDMSSQISSIFVGSSFATPILFLITNGDLLITLLTGGLIFSIILLEFYVRVLAGKVNSLDVERK